MRRSQWGLWAALSLSIIAVLLTVVGGSPPSLRALIAVPMVVALPGYAIVEALFHGDGGDGLRSSERLLMSVGASLIVAVLGSILLHYTSWGLHPVTWVLLLGGTTIVASATAIVRRRAVVVKVAAKKTSMDAVLIQGFLLALALSIAITAVVIARTGASSPHSAGFTELWVLPAKDSGPMSARIGVTNLEGARTAYRLSLLANGIPLYDWQPIELNQSGSWESTVIIPQQERQIEVVELLLYRLDATATPYRRVSLWMNDSVP